MSLTGIDNTFVYNKRFSLFADVKGDSIGGFPGGTFSKVSMTRKCRTIREAWLDSIHVFVRIVRLLSLSLGPWNRNWG